MAKNKTDYNAMNDDDLRNRINEFSDEYHAAKQKFRIGQFKKTSEFSRLRREVARINTELRSRQLKASQGK